MSVFVLIIFDDNFWEDNMNIILITGGAFQGKKGFAEKEFPAIPVLSDIHLLIRDGLLNGMTEEEAEADIFSKIEGIAESGQTVVISDDIGFGIVPIDPFERRYREVTGRIITDIAKKADQFFRVTAGIGERLK